jgi:hypothetical protein
MAALQCVLEAAPDYFERVSGAPPGSAQAQGMFTALPPDKTYADKFVWGLYEGEAMIGCADVIRGYPVPEKAIIGLETGEVKEDPEFVREVMVLEKPVARARGG